MNPEEAVNKINDALAAIEEYAFKEQSAHYFHEDNKHVLTSSNATALFISRASESDWTVAVAIRDSHGQVVDAKELTGQSLDDIGGRAFLRETEKLIAEVVNENFPELES